MKIFKWLVSAALMAASAAGGGADPRNRAVHPYRCAGFAGRDQ